MKAAQTLCERAEQSLRKKFRKPIFARFTKAINEYQLLQPGDRVAVCISGGKDSMLMAKLFQELKRHDKFPFSVEFIVMDPGYTDANRRQILQNAEALCIPVHLFTSDIFASVYHITQNPCYLCARMRRGHLYAYAQSLGCNKIALGHHFNDVVETTLMGMFYSSQLQAMMPKLHSANFEGMELIRPLNCVQEEDIIAWADANRLSFIHCACPLSRDGGGCDSGSQGKRAEVKQLLQRLKQQEPDIEKSIFNSLHAVCLDTFPGYKEKGTVHSFLDHYDE